MCEVQIYILKLKKNRNKYTESGGCRPSSTGGGRVFTPLGGVGVYKYHCWADENILDIEMQYLKFWR